MGWPVKRASIVQLINNVHVRGGITVQSVAVAVYQYNTNNKWKRYWKHVNGHVAIIYAV